jgi:hypothetical protein
MPVSYILNNCAISHSWYKNTYWDTIVSLRSYLIDSRMATFHGLYVTEYNYGGELRLSHELPEYTYGNTTRDASWMRRYLRRVPHRDTIICDERNNSCQHGRASMELITSFAERVHEQKTVQSTIILHADYYEVILEGRSMKYNFKIVLKLPISIGDGMWRAITAVYDLVPVRIEIKSDPRILGDVAEIPSCILEWMRQTRTTDGVWVVKNRRIVLTLPDRPARLALQALLQLDLSKRNNNQTSEIEFIPMNFNQVKLYFDTLLKYNTYLAMQDGQLVCADYEARNMRVKYCCYDAPDPNHASMLCSEARIVYLMDLVQTHKIHGIDMQLLGTGDSGSWAVCHLQNGIIWTASIFRHLQPTIEDLSVRRQTVLDSQMRCLQRMLEIRRRKHSDVAMLPIETLQTDHYAQISNVNLQSDRQHLEQSATIMIQERSRISAYAMDILHGYK